MNKLVDTHDIIKAANLNGIAGGSAAKVLMSILRLNKVNRLYSKLSDKSAIEFIDSLIDELGIKFELNEEELNRIPRDGAFISISNHPFGGIDGMLLVKLVSQIRPDYKVFANFLLQRIQPVKEYVLPVNPFETHKDSRSSFTGIKEAFSHLENEGSLGMFPAGEVSTYSNDMSKIQDRQWQYSILKFIKRAQVPVVPVYFQGSNSRFFHLLGIFHPLLRTVRLPSELFNKKNKLIKIRIGHPISVKEQNEFKDISQYGRYLRMKTYSLGTTMEVKKFFHGGLRKSQKQESLIDPVPTEKIESEIEKIRDNHLLFSSKSYEIYCIPSLEIPNITTELGRLREITFRDVGEGTNRKIDIDEFDLYYHQLFIWDTETRQIVGAYRVGKGKEIIEQYGLKGFYIQSLFKISSKFIPILKESIELGRSFVIKEYQRRPLPLFMLWKGILYFLIKNPEYRYLIGPVSISGKFSTFTKSVIIKFIEENYYNQDFARFIKPRKNFKVPTTDIDMDILFENASNDIKKIDKFIKDVEPTNYRMPVLLKKYLQQNGKIIGFNIDPKFNDALDGLLILDLFDVPMETITSLSKEINDESLLDRFFYNDFNYINSIPQL